MLTEKARYLSTMLQTRGSVAKTSLVQMFGTPNGSPNWRALGFWSRDKSTLGGRVDDNGHFVPTRRYPDARPEYEPRADNASWQYFDPGQPTQRLGEPADEAGKRIFDWMGFRRLQR